MNKVLPEFAWMAEETAGLARASDPTKERIRNLLHAKRLVQSDFRFFVPQVPLAWQRQDRESMVIEVRPSKFRNKQK